MTTSHTIECTLTLGRRGRQGRRSLPAGPAPLPSSPVDTALRSPGRVPRIAPHGSGATLRATPPRRHGPRLRGVGQARTGHPWTDHADHEPEAIRPDIQEQLLFLPRVQRGRDPISLHHLQAIATILDWRKQRGMWKALQRDLQG